MPLSTKDNQVRLDILNTIVDGLGEGLLSKQEHLLLRDHVDYCKEHSSEFSKLKQLYLDTRKRTLTQVEVDRKLMIQCSVLKALARYNGRAGQAWHYTTATKWKEALLGDVIWSEGQALGGKTEDELVALLARPMRFVPKALRKKERVASGDVGSVTIVELSNGESVVFKPAQDTHNFQKATYLGIAGDDAKLNNRSVATYLLAYALGIEGIVVRTTLGFYEDSSASLRRGILMDRAAGYEPTVKACSRERIQENRPRTDGDAEMLWALSLEAHRRAEIKQRTLRDPQCVIDLYAATWLDHLASQVDRHPSNMLIDVDNAGTYRGLKLIDNDCSFGTLGSYAAIREAVSGSVTSLMRDCPQHIPVELKTRLLAISAAIVDAGEFWKKSCEHQQANPWNRQLPQLPQQGGEAPQQQPLVERQGLFQKPVGPRQGNFQMLGSRAQQHQQLQQQMQQVHDQGQLEEPMRIMAGIARLLSKQEFVALASRMREAAGKAQLANALTTASAGQLVSQFENHNPTSEAWPAVSYWHELAQVYGPDSAFPVLGPQSSTNYEKWVAAGAR